MQVIFDIIHLQTSSRELRKIFDEKNCTFKEEIWELITPVLSTKNLMWQLCKDQGLVMNILKIKLEQLG